MIDFITIGICAYLIWKLCEKISESSNNIRNRKK